MKKTSAGAFPVADPAGFGSSPLSRPGGRFSPNFDFATLGAYLNLGIPGFTAEAEPLDEGPRFFECEDLLGGWRRETEHPDFSGLSYVSSGAPGAPFKRPLTLRFRTQTSGTVTIWVRCWFRGGQPAPLSLVLNGRAAGAPLSVVGGGAGPSFRWESYGPIETEAGLQVMQVLPRLEGQEDVDALVITLNREWRPPVF